jgi:hypothetical protein
MWLLVATARAQAPALADALPVRAAGGLVRRELPPPPVVLLPRTARVLRPEPPPAWRSPVQLGPLAGDAVLNLLGGAVAPSIEGWIEQRDLERRPVGEPLPPLR